jgi:hypothetical protein
VQQGTVQDVSVTEDKLAIRIPLGPDDEDNYIVGLALDTTSQQQVHHPTDNTKDDLPACPTLLVATTDAVLRLYRFGHLQQQQSYNMQPVQLPAAAPAWLQQAVAAARSAPVDPTAAAAAVGLPGEAQLLSSHMRCPAHAAHSDTVHRDQQPFSWCHLQLLKL